MARLLYRLGLFASKRAWLVLVSWFALLAIAISLMAGFAGKLSSSMSIDGVQAQLVIDRLKNSFPEASRGQGQVVFHNPNGELTSTQRAEIAAALAEAAKVPGISEIADPFEITEQMNSQRQELADGEAEIADARTKLAEAERELAEGKADLERGKEELATNKAELLRTQTELTENLNQVSGGITQLELAGAPAAAFGDLYQNRAALELGLTQVEAGLQQIAQAELQIAQGEAKLEAGERELAEGKKELEDGAAQLALGQRLAKITEDFGVLSKDGSTAFASVFFTLPVNETEDATTKGVVDLLSELRSDDLQVEFSQALTTSFGDLLGAGEIVGLAFAAIVLLVMLGSALAAGMPVLAAVLGVGISASVTMALSGTIEMTTTTPILGVMLGLAVGIDYSLFLLNRHRKQLKAGMEVRESIALATGTSGNAVVFAGFTVIIALVALNLTGIGFLGLMGTMGALAIALAVLIAITFTPAMLSLIGEKVLSRRERKRLVQEKLVEPLEAKPTLAAKHPWLSVLGVVLILGIVAIPASSMRLGLPDGSSEPLDSTTYKAYKLVSDNFGAGANGGIATVVTFDSAVSEDDELEAKVELAEKLGSLENVSVVLPADISADRKTLLFQVVPESGPASVETERLVLDLRALEGQIKTEFQAELGVTGMTATNIDISEKLSQALPLYLGTVLALSLLLLILVFRSILVPLIASLGFLATVFATFGAVVAVYQWGWLGFLFDVHDPGPILNFLPTILIGILFGLAMDYQLFLASGIREAYVHGKSPIAAINSGIRLSRSVVIAAALIMIFVFGGFAFNHLAMIRPVGFGLAIGVLIDAFLVRLVLVPALLALLGDKAWWLPKWLERVLPNVDVEGSSLKR